MGWRHAGVKANVPWIFEQVLRRALKKRRAIKRGKGGKRETQGKKQSETDRDGDEDRDTQTHKRSAWGQRDSRLRHRVRDGEIGISAGLLKVLQEGGRALH